MYLSQAMAKLRIRRILLIVCSVISLVALALWLHSYIRDDRFLIVSDRVGGDVSATRTVLFQSSLGGTQVLFEQISAGSLERARAFRFYRRTSTPGYFSFREPTYPQVRADHEDSVFYALGVQASFVDYTRDPGDLHESRSSLTLPWWMIFVTFSAYPIICYVTAVIRQQQDDRVALGLCPRCGVPSNNLLARCLGCDKPIAVLSEI